MKRKLLLQIARSLFFFSLGFAISYVIRHYILHY